jgi:hypothetical protein
MIRDKSNMLATQRREFFHLENVEACLYAARAARFFNRGVRRNTKGKNENEALQNDELFRETSTAMTLGQSIPSAGASPMIFWNASFGAAL